MALDEDTREHLHTSKTFCSAALAASHPPPRHLLRQSLSPVAFVDSDWLLMVPSHPQPLVFSSLQEAPSHPQPLVFSSLQEASSHPQLDSVSLRSPESPPLVSSCVYVLWSQTLQKLMPPAHGMPRTAHRGVIISAIR